MSELQNMLNEKLEIYLMESSGRTNIKDVKSSIKTLYEEVEERASNGDDRIIIREIENMQR